MTQFWIGFIGWPVIVAATIWLNWYRIEVRKRKPYYFASNWSRGIFGFACLVLMTVEKGFDPAVNFLFQIWHVSPEIIYIASSFYLFFDPGLSGLRGKRWNYKGKASGWFDKLPMAAYYSIKIVCATAFIYSLIILL